MANEDGTPSAPNKAAEKSVGVTGAQAVQMLVKRQEAAPAKESTRAVTPEPEPKKAEATQTPATTEEAKPATPAEEVKAEPKEETPEAEQLPPDEVLSTLSPEQRERMDRRIAKEVAKRKALESEIARLRAQQNPPARSVPDKLPPVPSINPDSPVSKIMDAASLQQQVEQALEVKDWAQSQLDADVNEAHLDGKVYDKTALRNAVRNADRFVTREAPKQLAFIQAKAQADRQTAEFFGAQDWMQDKSSEAYQAYQLILQDPDIAKRANASWMAAVQVQGLIDVRRRMQSAGKKPDPLPTEKPKAPASQTASGAGFAPSREASGSAAVKALQADLEKLKGKKGVTGRDLEGYFLKMEKARTR